MGTESFTDKELQFINLLLSGYSTEEAGAAVNISRRSSFLWRKKPHIEEAIEAGNRGALKVVEALQQERVKTILPQVTDTLTDAIPKALQTLIDLMENAARDDTKLKAAVEILRLGGIEKTTKIQSTQEHISSKNKGLTPEDAAQIRRQILGINANAVEKI